MNLLSEHKVCSS